MLISRLTEILKVKITCPIFHLAGTRERDSAISASNDVSSAQDTSTVTSNNDKLCYGFISLYHIFIRIYCKLLVIISPTDAKTGRHNSTIEGKRTKGPRNSLNG